MGGPQGSKKSANDGFGSQGNCITWFLVVLEYFSQAAVKIESVREVSEFGGGLGGPQGSKKGANDGFGSQGNCITCFLVVLEYFGQAAVKIESVRGVSEFGGGWGLPRGPKRVQLMGLGLKATVPLGFWSFWSILVRLQSRLKVCEESRNLEGFGGSPGVQQGCN